MRSHRDVPRLLLWALRLRHELARAPGLFGYSLAADLRDKTLWTVSAWSSRVELGQFDRSAAHRGAKDRLRPRMMPSTLVMWNCRAGELPVAWTEARSRIFAAGSSSG